jgi:hypothetical protein
MCLFSVARYVFVHERMENGRHVITSTLGAVFSVLYTAANLQ